MNELSTTSFSFGSNISNNTPPPFESVTALSKYKDPSQPLKDFFPINELTPSDIISLFFLYLNPQDSLCFSLTCKKVEAVLNTHSNLENVRRNISLYYNDNHIKRFLKPCVEQRMNLSVEAITRLQNIRLTITCLDLSGLKCSSPIQTTPSVQQQIFSLTETMKNLFINVSTYFTGNTPTQTDSPVQDGLYEETLIQRIGQVFTGIQELKLDNADKIGTSLYHLKNMTSLTCLSLKRIPSGIGSIPQLSHLKFLDLSGTLLSDKEYDELSFLTNLQDLHLYNESIDDMSWIHGINPWYHKQGSITTNQLQKLVSVPLKSVLLSPHIPFSALKDHTQLTSLALVPHKNTRLFTEDDFEQLGTLTSLQSLNFYFGTTPPTTDNLQFLTKLLKLQTLIFGCKNHLPALPPCNSVRDIVFFNHAAGEEVVESLSGMKMLQNLRILSPESPHGNSSGSIDLSWFQNFVPPQHFEKLFLSCSTLISSSISESSYKTAFSTLKHLYFSMSSEGSIPSFLLHLDTIKSAIIWAPGNPDQLKEFQVGPHLRHLFIHFGDRVETETIEALRATPFVHSLYTLGVQLTSTKSLENLPLTPKKLVINGLETRIHKKLLKLFQSERAKKGQEVILSSENDPFITVEQLFTNV